MNADVRPIKTAAEQALADAFATVKVTLPGRSEVAAQREAAFRRFEAEGLPHRRIEDWKYTDLRALMRQAKPLADAPGREAVAKARGAKLRFSDVDAYRVVFVDGHFAAELSTLPVLEATAMQVDRLSDHLANGGGLFLKRGLPITFDIANTAIDLNTALVADGCVISVRNKPSSEQPAAKPIHVMHVRTSSTDQAAYVRLLVNLADDADLTLIESFEDLSGKAHQTNTLTHALIGDRAKLNRVVFNAESNSTLHLDSFVAWLEAGSALNSFAMTTGSEVSRSQSFVLFGGPNGKATISGASLLKARQHVDTTLVIDHAMPGGTSRELFKSVLDGESRGVFQGKIIVRPGAQKTDGRMMTQALLLSETAEADNKPELEIFADDVQCGHGATAGALDGELLFYLRARGIPPNDAEALLIQAFVGEATETVAHDGLKEALTSAAVEWLQARG